MLMKRPMCKRLAVILCFSFLLSGTISFAAQDDFFSTADKPQILSDFTEKYADMQALKSLQNEELIVPGKLVVKFKNSDIAIHNNTIQSLRKGYIQSFEKADDSGVMTVSLAKDADIYETMRVISSQPGVEFVEPLYIYEAYQEEIDQETVSEAVYKPNDPYYMKNWQWGLQAIGIEDMWDRVPVSRRNDVTIAILDTGVDADHPDLMESLVPGYDFVNDDDDPDDDNSHGTHVAGIAAAITNNEQGIAGVAGGSKIMPIKVMNDEGRGNSLDIYLGIIYAVKNGADVINMSLGSSAPSQLIKEAVEYALSRDVVVVASTGNAGKNEVGFPAAFDGVIGVGAVDWDSANGFTRVNFSNYGPETDLVAPGVDILSTIPLEIDLYDGNQDGYTLLQGTSMASPFVAGMAALLKAENPELTNEQIQQALETKAYDILEEGRDLETGEGVVNGNDDCRVPVIVEYPNIVISGRRIDKDTIEVSVIALKAKGLFNKATLVKGMIDEEFSGEITVNVDQLYSNPSNTYYPIDRVNESDGVESLADFKAQTEDGNIITLTLDRGVGTYTIDFTSSGNYLFSLNPSDKTKDYVLTDHLFYYPARVNDVTISGELILEKPFNEDLKIYLVPSSQYTQYYDEPVSFTIPKNTTSIPYSMNVIRDTNYILYYCIQNDNDIYYNYGFYKTADITTHDPMDFTFLDLSQGSITDVNLNISAVPDLDDDVSDTMDGATLLPLAGLSPEAPDGFGIYSLEYQGDRDYFTFEIPARGQYNIAVNPLAILIPRISMYDSDKKLIKTALNEIDVDLAPGKYFVKVEDDTGFYAADYVLLYYIPEQPDQPEVVEFTDPKLEDAVRGILGLTVGEAVYANKVEGIEKLDLSDLDIESLGGLEHFKRLWCLELRNNRISDLTPLQDLSALEVLDLKGNHITDINPLCNLDILAELDVSENEISVLPDDFSALTELYHIDFSHNKISDLKSLATLPAIEALFLQDNQITSLEGLEGLNALKVLYLGENPITNDPSTDYSPLASYYLNLEDKDFFALPTATNVDISGTTRVGRMLTGHYTYTNMNNHEESGTTYQWLRSAEKDGDYADIPGAAELTYTLTSDDLDKYIKIRVIPGAAGEPSVGLAAESQPVGPIRKSGSGGSDGGGDSGDGGGGSGDGGGSGSGSYQPSPTPTPTSTPTPTQVPTIEPTPTPAGHVETDKNGWTTLVVDTEGMQLAWDTSPVIDAASDIEVNGTRINLTEAIFKESLANNKPFTVSTNLASFEIQPGTVNIPEGTGSITLSVNYLTPEDIPEAQRPAEATEVSYVFDFELLVGEDPVTTFDKPITITLKLDLSAVSNTDKVGVYYYSEAEGKWVFIGGKVNADGTVTFTTDHFSKFLAMEFNKTFSDIVDHWAKDSIEVMAARHVTEGTGNNRFSPDAKITRAEFTAMIVRALGITEEAGQNPFIDVKAGDWFADSALKANAAGIIQGDSKGNFAPGNMITREEMAAIAVRAYSYYSGVNADRIITTQEIRFTDMDDASEWARKSITLADALALMNGFSDKTFRPKDLSTRAEAIVVVNRLMKLLEIF